MLSLLSLLKERLVFSDNVTFSNFYQFQKIGNDADAILRISGKPLTKYGNRCDGYFPLWYDRMTFSTFVYSGPATTADFIVADTCNIVADANITQKLLCNWIF
jgi:hypothetical protein